MFHYEREPVSPLRRRFIDDLRLRNKSPRTIETYVLRVPSCPQCGGNDWVRFDLPKEVSGGCTDTS